MQDLEFLAEKAKELLDRQIESYRLNHTKAGTIIGISAIFLPVFLFVIEKASPIIQVLSVLPLIFFGISLYIMIRVLRSRPLDQGFRPEKLDILVNEDYEDILLYEIGAKKDSFRDNEIISDRQNKRFDRGLRTTIIAITLSILLLFGNIFINNQNKFTMGDKDKKETTTSSDEKKKRVIPSVPKEDRIQLNEGVKPKTKGDSKK